MRHKRTNYKNWPDHIRKPNLFLVGSPKCGTTTIYNWLSHHHEVFFCSPKEPHFFNTDHGYRIIYKLSDYADLFVNAPKSAKVIAEGSVWYLLSENAIDNILEFNPESKFVAMVRHPIEMAVSLHAQQVRSFYEDVDDFELAWRQNGNRQRGLCAPKAPEPRLLDYATACMQGMLLMKLLEKVANDRVFVGSMHDLKTDPELFSKRLFKFLSVSSDVELDYSPVNVGYRFKSRRIASVLSSLADVKKNMGINLHTNILNKIWKVNTREVGKEINPLLLKEMEGLFREDWECVKSILSRNL